MGYAPVDDPEIAIYVVVDRPNAKYQDDAKFATRIVRQILTEVLPHQKIYMTEELSDAERAELEALQLEIRTTALAGTGDDQEGGTGAAGDAGMEGDAGQDEGEATEETEETEGTEGTDGTEGTGEGGGADTERREVWKSFPIDPETGYAVDPNTGALVDPDTGVAIGGSFQDNGGGSILPPVDNGNTDIPY
jgi:stage V sporulation protein D (sporulation-specific penicillin-binding protein)